MSIRAIVLIMTMMIFWGTGGKAGALEVGDPAPVVSAKDQDGQIVNFQDVYSKGITLVYFYPKSDTPGCTAQACSLRDAFAALAAKNLVILGVSRDSVEAQKKFQEKFHLPFPILSDRDGKIAEAFGVSGVMGLPVSKRQSFLIKDGKVVWMTPKAKTTDHAEEVRAALDSIK